MGLETAVFIASLVPTNPPSTDLRKQGDDHLRLIKTALQGSFPNSTKAWYNPDTLTKTANYTVLATDMNKVILVDTTSGVLTMTMPTLVSGDAGWECNFIKTNTGTNPYLIAPPSGTIQSGEIAGSAATRRCIPGKRTKIIWTGTAWIAERVVHVPVGTILDCPRATCPVGYEFAMGQTLTSASTNYPDYVSAFGGGVVSDRQGVAAFGRTNMDGLDNSKITSAGSGIDGTFVGALGGTQAETLDTTKIPLHGHTFTGSALGAHDHGVGSPTVLNASVGGSGLWSGGGNGLAAANITLPSVSAGTPAGSISNTGGGLPHNNMPPAIITNFIIVVE